MLPREFTPAQVNVAVANTPAKPPGAAAAAAAARARARGPPPRAVRAGCSLACGAGYCRPLEQVLPSLKLVAMSGARVVWH